MNRKNAMPTTAELLNRGINCLIEKMGVIETEAFVAAVQRENFDYTQWHQESFAKNESIDDFLQKASDFAKNKAGQSI